MADIVSLPESAKTRAAHRRLARWLRDLADYIEGDQLETEPHAALIVLTGVAQHEVLIAGYGDDNRGCEGAMNAARAVIAPSYRTEGGNIRARNHDHYGMVLRKSNIVDFTAVSLRRTQQTPGA